MYEMEAKSQELQNKLHPSELKCSELPEKTNTTLIGHQQYCTTLGLKNSEERV